MKVKVTEYNIHNGAIWWRISTSVKVVMNIFALALTVCDILLFLTFNLENLGKGPVVEKTGITPFDKEYQPN